MAGFPPHALTRHAGTLDDIRVARHGPREKIPVVPSIFFLPIIMLSTCTYSILTVDCGEQSFCSSPLALRPSPSTKVRDEMIQVDNRSSVNDHSYIHIVS